MENTKPKKSNLFMHGIGLKFCAQSDIERIMAIGYDWHQKHVKKIGNIMHENQIFHTSMH